MTPGIRREYLRLCEQFPPRSIQSQRRFRETQVVIDALIDKPGKLTAAESEYLATLTERGLRQKDLAPVFGAESIVSAVLNGRRKLNRRHIEGLAAFFRVSPAVFFPALPSARKEAA